jgi:hypothetical protein
MTPAQQSELRAAVHANPACAMALSAKDCAAIAAIMSEGRTRGNTREIGNGTILETLGIAAGNTFLDFINGSADFRYVKPLIEQGRLQIGSLLVQATVQSMVPGVLTQPQADALCALGIEPHPYTAQEICEAVFNPDGSEK